MGHAVAIVVDRNFGEALEPLARRIHVWLCASVSNRAAADLYRLTDPDHSLERGVTTFGVENEETAEEMLIKVLADVNLHHGEYSHSPPWDTLEVYGTPATPPIRKALEAYRVTDFTTTGNSFRCTKLAGGAA